ncbi:MAG TPA: PAS-domain containing protein, partial [Pseudolabrys sp.]|nr:PAS-domain containing protein [Pseudolabrys sp.]
MPSLNLISGIASHAILVAVIIAFAITAVLYHRLRVQNRRLLSAINNMSQGLNMFDAQGRITLLNRRYLEMYSLSPDIVKTGCTLQELISYRKSTGLFSGDVEAYCRKILEEMKQKRSMSHYV